MNKKIWTDRLEGLKKTRKVAEFNKSKAENDIEELNLIISVITKKIKTFK